jgi:hypothetical protein
VEWQGLVELLLAQAVEAGETTPGLDVQREAVLLLALVDGLGIRATFDRAHFGQRALAAAVDTALDGLRRASGAARLAAR